MRRALYVAAIAAAFALAGCANTPKEIDSGSVVTTEYHPDGTVAKKTEQRSEYATYTEAVKSGAAPTAKVILTAAPGTTIQNLVGVHVEVPMVGGNANASIQAPTPPMNGWQFLDSLSGRLERVGTTFIPWYYGADAVKAISSDMRRAGTAGYPFVQAPQANVTTTTSVTASGPGAAAAAGGNATGSQATTTTNTTNTTTTTTTDNRVATGGNTTTGNGGPANNP